MIRVLVVEDSRSQALEAAYILEKAGMQPTPVVDGPAALEALSRQSFDLVLSDIKMPGMSGYELCRHIRQNAATRALPVILLTTLTSPADIFRGLECRSDNYITKPYTPDYLVERIQTILESRRGRPEHVSAASLEVTVKGQRYDMDVDMEKTLDFLVTTVDECMRMREKAHEQRLEAETERFFTLSVDMLAMVDYDGRFQRLNPAWERSLGFSEAELLTVKWTDFMHRDDRAAAHRHLSQGGVSFESRFRNRQGAFRRLLWCASPATDDGVYYVAAQDITDRVREEEAARRRARLQTAMADLGHRALAEGDLSVLGADVCRRVQEALDTDHCILAEVQPDRSLVLLHAFPPDGDATGLLRVARLAVLDSGLVRVRHVVSRAQTTVSLVVPGRFGPYGVLSVQRAADRPFDKDETAFLEGFASILASAMARSEAETELRQSEERNRLLLDSTAEAIFGMDLTGRCTFCNPAALSLLGYTHSDQLLGRYMHGMIHHSHADGREYRPEDCPVERGETVHVDDEVLWRADGTSFQAEYWSYPVCRNGVRVGGVVTFLDITRRRLLEEQVRQSQKMEAVGRLAGGIAHDFNNLLTVVLGYCDLLEKEPTAMTGDAREMLGEINNAATRASGLTRQLLSLSRREAICPQDIDLNTVVANIDRLLSRVLGGNVSLQVELSPVPLEVRMDPVHLEQILVNLVVNARDAMPAGGNITVRTARVHEHEPADTVVPRGTERLRLPAEPREGAYHVLSVQDTGTGIPPEVLVHIFEPFFTTKPEGQGTGLGLSTVFGIAQTAQAHIEVRSEVGRGTTFILYFRPSGRAAVSTVDGSAPGVPDSGSCLSGAHGS